MYLKIKPIIKNKNLLELCLFIFLGVCIFFPVDQYNIKFITIFLMFLICGNCIINNLFKKEYSLVLNMGIIFPIILIIQSFLLTKNFIISLSGAYVLFLLIWLIPIIEYNIDYSKLFMNLLKTEAIIIVLLGILDIFEVYNINQNGIIRNFIYKWEIGFIGKSTAYAFYYKIFFKTSPLLIFLFDYSWTHKKLFTLVISSLALMFTGTRANIFVICIYVVWRLMFMTLKEKKNKIVLNAFIIIILFLLLPNIFKFLENIMNTTGSIQSDHIRNGQLQGFIEVFKDFSKLLFGSGFGSSFYDYGRNKLMSSAEYAYFNLLRQIGLILFIPYLIFIFTPLFKKIKKNLKMIYLGYLIISFTNPLLFSSTAFIAYIYIYIYIYRKNVII